MSDFRTRRNDQEDLTLLLLERRKESLRRYIREIEKEAYSIYIGQEEKQLKKIASICADALRDPV